MKRNLLAVAVLAAFAGQASAATSLHQVSGTETITDSVNYGFISEVRGTRP